MIESFSISFFSPLFCSFLLLLLLFCFCLFFDGIVFFFLFGSVVQVHSHYNSCIKILFQFLRLTLHSAPVLFRRPGVFGWVLRLIIVSTNHGLMEHHCYTHRQLERPSFTLYNGTNLSLARCQSFVDLLRATLRSEKLRTFPLSLQKYLNLLTYGRANKSASQILARVRKVSEP